MIPYTVLLAYISGQYYDTIHGIVGIYFKSILWYHTRYCWSIFHVNIMIPYTVLLEYISGQYYDTIHSIVGVYFMLI